MPQGNSGHHCWAGCHYQGAGAGVIVVIGQPRGLVVMACWMTLGAGWACWCGRVSIDPLLGLGERGLIVVTTLELRVQRKKAG